MGVVTFSVLVFAVALFFDDASIAAASSLALFIAALFASSLAFLMAAAIAFSTFAFLLFKS